jgi:hypothetical protein
MCSQTMGVRLCPPLMQKKSCAGNQRGCTTRLKAAAWPCSPWHCSARPGRKVAAGYQTALVTLTSSSHNEHGKFVVPVMPTAPSHLVLRLIQAHRPSQARPFQDPRHGEFYLHLTIGARSRLTNRAEVSRSTRRRRPPPPRTCSLTLSRAQ